MNGLKSATLWIVIFVGCILIVLTVNQKSKSEKINIIHFFKLAKDKRIIGEVVDKGGRLSGEYVKQDGKWGRFTTQYFDSQAEKVLQVMLENDIQYDPRPPSALSQQMLYSLLPFIPFLILFFLIMRQIQGTGNKALSFGKSRARLVSEGQVKVTFDDVAGVEEAKEELREIVEFLKDPKRFTRLGGRIPKGVLLYGPSGTGKTLLAKAVAGEARVPFFFISGSDFVEMFVGVGASRVRDLFEQGKRSHPCLIFIDEIDAVGRHRFTGIGGGHDEREQTLNQLLVEMDGFDPNEGVILIAATNRPDVLDPALLRPGRFDRQIAVDIPDVRGREKILEVHSRDISKAPDVDLAVLAKATPGFSGADLANMVNEAALLAARNNKTAVDQDDFEEAKDRVLMGPERRSMILLPEDKKITAVHEVGHALCAKMTPDSDPVHKITIIPRGRALGLTSILPGDEHKHQTRRRLKSYLVYMLGGRAAEEIVFGEFTTGAADDLRKATTLAHRMICEFGMSEHLGPRTFGEPDNQVFLGREIAHTRNFSDETARKIDEEVQSFIQEAHDTSLKILRDNYDLLKNIADILVERETLTGDELDDLIQGKPLPPLKNNGNKGLPPNPVSAKKTTEVSETNQGLGEGNLNKLKPWKTPS
ncbi:MAG TPA: ATP-dependent zinc metalloprotease FtsH [Candidatus Sumerlaeota bacterium]|nr:ATP-dependent zinc metalloprotease FtsH [Candidatus Sumerlaeota bacterium]HON49742.1 ATP-dependent zinc metalloprotease FtsH [Candidatus Sumerlaeota bacterium]HOR64010.1 ATP-dependent zinc metalloprotease FtsH [Candidatus Sumerlaeota bacterium]HPL75230.1 ATP-dependent zinc metalloprotease FtsH [Candidatus Sumerlaeota bacterium]HRR30081.1 ATP-dependent zinc metalloprotease FtsH [Candidatus Sumerlaeia bacterium]